MINFTHSHARRENAVETAPAVCLKSTAHRVGTRKLIAAYLASRYTFKISFNPVPRVLDGLAHHSLK